MPNGFSNANRSRSYVTSTSALTSTATVKPNSKIDATGHMETCTYRFFFARGFATSRASSMKSCATGLSLRVFRVMMPTGTAAIDMATGRATTSDCLAENCNAEAVLHVEAI